ncbi:hypothetical protein DFH07DRAFT_173898 [Mycena maculata]|uniref:Uncharacterized protein n=1 Tax=Mycena maculata TaxID=230809 RepID=A0AAD7HY89_9AGAR|nr:hypothetical protein DFH07DRAFT_173898 [Mycena maculata]
MSLSHPSPPCSSVLVLSALAFLASSEALRFLFLSAAYYLAGPARARPNVVPNSNLQRTPFPPGPFLAGGLMCASDYMDSDPASNRACLLPARLSGGQVFLTLEPRSRYTVPLQP